MPKPAHLSWEESAVNALCSSTSYRMLVGDNGARMKQGDSVLIWGATGGIGGYAVQNVLNGGGTPIGVVSSPELGNLAKKKGGAWSIVKRGGLALAAGVTFVRLMLLPVIKHELPKQVRMVPAW